MLTTGLTIDGTGAAITVSGQNAIEVLHVGSGVTATIDDLVISNGSTGSTGNQGFGGGIYNAGNLTLNNVTVSHNSVSGNNPSANSGGGIYNDGTLTLAGCTVTQNSATNYDNADGGGIANSGTMTITNSTVSNNSASEVGGGGPSDGGGICNEGTLTLNDDTLSGNSAGAGGGICNFPGATATVTNTSLSKNSASGEFIGGSGGGIYNSGGNLTLSGGTTFSNNSATSGGGIYDRNGFASSANVTLLNVTFTANSATSAGGGFFDHESNGVADSGDIFTGNTAGSGGGIYIYAASFTLGTDMFTNNTAKSGGGVFATAGGDVTISNSTFTTNSATSAGGGVYANAGGNLTLTSDTFTSNSANGDGGGVCSGSNNLSGNNDTFTENTARSGGGIYSQSTLTVSSSNFAYNDANQAGGGVYAAAGGTETFSTDKFTANSALQLGGGAIYSQSNLTVSGSTFTQNDSPNGGAVCVDAGNTTLSSDTFANNQALITGGAVAVLTSGNVTFQSDTIAGNGTFSGGGIYNLGITKVYDTIVDSNTASTGADVQNSGSFISSGGNLYGSSNGVTWKSNDIQNADPKLGLLQNNGGPTQTMAELPGSPALGNGLTTNSPATDQRGLQRVVNGKIDIGAFENQSQWFTFTPPAEPGPYYAGLQANFSLGALTYRGTAANAWTVDVNWGDGSADTTFTASSGGPTYNLGSKPHTYASAGSYTITVTVTDADANFGQTQSNTFSVSVPPVPTTIISISGGQSQSAIVGTAFGTNLEVTVDDQYGQPLAGVTVLFIAPTSGPSGTFTGGLTAAAVTTNANGDATAPTFTANNAAGSYRVTAAVSGVSKSVNFGLANYPFLGDSPNAVFVENVYRQLLNRYADAGAQTWINALDSGTSPATVIQAIEQSAEYLNDVVNALYQHYLFRAADSGGLAGWTSLLAGGESIESVTASILASPEFFDDQGGGNAGFVQGLYQDVLERTGSADEVQGWVSDLANGATRYQVAFAFLTSTEYRTDLVAGFPGTAYRPNWAGYFPAFLLRAADPGGLAFWTQQIASGMTDQVVLAAIFGSAEGYAKWS